MAHAPIIIALLTLTRSSAERAQGMRQQLVAEASEWLARSVAMEAATATQILGSADCTVLTASSLPALDGIISAPARGTAADDGVHPSKMVPLSASDNVDAAQLHAREGRRINGSRHNNATWIGALHDRRRSQPSLSVPKDGSGRALNECCWPSRALNEHRRSLTLPCGALVSDELSGDQRSRPAAPPSRRPQRRQACRGSYRP